MQRASTGTAPFYADVYLKAEEVAFRQATLISVISEHVKADLVSRGIDAAKILVNPERRGSRQRMRPPPPDEKRAHPGGASASTIDDRVIGFTGTFGGWHGIDVLAAAIPRICAADAGRASS